jgi:hypothetical protein
VSLWYDEVFPHFKWVHICICIIFQFKISLLYRHFEVNLFIEKKVFTFSSVWDVGRKKSVVWQGNLVIVSSVLAFVTNYYILQATPMILIKYERKIGWFFVVYEVGTIPIPQKHNGFRFERVVCDINHFIYIFSMQRKMQ